MINSIDSWKGFIKSEEVLITFSPSIGSFDSELSCTYDVPPPPSFSWEEVGSILMGIYRHSPELASKCGSSPLPTDVPCLTDTPSHATVTYSSANQQQQSYSGFPEEEEEDVDDDEREPASIYSEPPIQRLLVPPIKICLTEKKKKKGNTKNESIFRISAEEFIRALNSKGRMDIHFCFCWATKRPFSTKATKRLEEIAWTHDDFALLAEGLRGGEEAAKRATENLFRAAERLLEEPCLGEGKKNVCELERALLCVSGCSYSNTRIRALNLLEILYNNRHPMKFCAEEKPAFLCVGDKMDICLDAIDEKKQRDSLLYVQVFFRGAVSWHRLWGCTGPKIKLTLAHAVKHPGFYDWRLVNYDVEQGGAVKETLQRGRFVVLPAPKEDLRTYKTCSFLRPKFSGDRASFTATTDKQFSDDEDLCVVNFPLSVGALSWNNRYRKHISFCCERGDGSSVPTYSVAQSAETGCAVLNYRMPETVDLLLSELQSWLGRTGGRPPKRVVVVLQGDWPFLCAASADEMACKDEDGSFHHADAEAALESPLVNQGEVVRMEAESGTNVILTKVAQAIWRTYPNASLCIETSDPEQCDKALRSGFIPVDKVVEAMFAPSPEKGAYGRAKTHIPARGCAPAVVRIPPDAHRVSPFARTLAQYGFVSVLGKALAPENYLFEDELEVEEEEVRERDPTTAPEPRVYPVEWRGLDGRPEQRIVSFAVRHGGRVVLAAFMPEGSGGVTAEPVFGSELSALMPSVLRVSSAARRGALLLVPPQHMTRGELCNEPHFTDFIPGNDGIQVWTIAPSACPDEVLYESSVYRLAGLVDRGISPAGNMVYDLLQEAAAKRGTDAGRLLLERLAAAIPRSVDRVFGNVLSRLFYVTHDLPLCLLSTLRSGCAEMLRGGELGAVVFVSSEMGRFSTVGGVGVLVDELTRSIARQGYSVYVVTPYFNYNKYGHTNYLRPEDGFSYVGNVTVGIGDWERQDFGIHVGKENGVNLVFLHNYTYFPTPYSGETPEYKLRSVVALSKAALQACIFLNIKPSIIISNDWPTALVAPYGNGLCLDDSFNGCFKKTKFFHIIHNVEKGYDGELFFDNMQEVQRMHNIPSEIIQYGDKCINLTMAALKSVENWGTVSKSYQRDLVEHSKFSGVMRRCPDSFAFSNGIRSEDRLNTLRKISPALSHEDTKRVLQEKYFGRSDPSVPVFGFVGRICEQKGVELLAYVAQDIISRTNGRAQFIIGGYAPANDPYAKRCAAVLNRLHAEHPAALWADPERFFLDGGLVNLGADFAVMPSLFEPGGIVQHEFFVAGTPVIAFKTGGLKDTVVEFDRASKEGNGFTFEGYRHEDLLSAVTRALDLYNNSGPDYQTLRENARRSVLDMEVVATMWTNEFCRMCGALPPPLIHCQ